MIPDVGTCSGGADSGLRASSLTLRGIYSGAGRDLLSAVDATPNLTLKRPVRSRNYPLVPYLVDPASHPMSDLPTFLGMAAAYQALSYVG